MSKYILFILTIVFASTAVAQQERSISKTVANQFHEKYNANDYEGVFSLFSDEMKSFMPHDKAIAFLNGLSTEAGKIKKRTFVKYPQQNVALYKTNFERLLVALFISVDVNSKISGLMVKPFAPEKLPTLNRNTSNLILPFNEEWTVFWGGDTK